MQRFQIYPPEGKFLPLGGNIFVTKGFFEIFPALAGFSEYVTVVEISVCHAQRYMNETRNAGRGGSFRSSVMCAGSKLSTDTVG